MGTRGAHLSDAHAHSCVAVAWAAVVLGATPAVDAWRSEHERLRRCLPDAGKGRCTLEPAQGFTVSAVINRSEFYAGAKIGTTSSLARIERANAPGEHPMRRRNAVLKALADS